MVISGASSTVKVVEAPEQLCFDQPVAALPSTVAFFAYAGMRM